MPRSSLSVIIPAAGSGRRMRSFGPKSAIRLAGGETVLGRQLAVLGRAYPGAEFVVVVGYEADRVARIVPPGVRVVENENHDRTGVLRSIGMGLRASAGKAALVVYGDLVFTPEAVAGLTRHGSCVVADTAGRVDPSSVGLTVESGRAAHFDFGLPAKWAQIAYLRGPELELFRGYALRPERRMCYGFEGLNHVLDGGGRLRAVEPEGMGLVEIDSSGDVGRAGGVR